MAAMAIKTLLGQLDVDHQNVLYSYVNTWLTAEKVLKYSHLSTFPHLVPNVVFFGVWSNR